MGYSKKRWLSKAWRLYREEGKVRLGRNVQDLPIKYRVGWLKHMAPIGKWWEIGEIGADLWGSLSISVKINPEGNREPVR